MLLFFFCHPLLSFSLDWKTLNEESERTSLSDAQTAVENSPGSVTGLYRLGLVYLNLHKDNKAEAVFNKMISLGAGSKEAKWGLAEILRRKHKLDESEKILNEVINSLPGFFPAYISLAYIQYIHLDFNKSIQTVYKVIQQGKQNVDPCNLARAYLILAGSKGMLAYRGGFFSKLINGTPVFSILRKAESLKSDSAEVMLGMGSFYLLAPVFAGRDIDAAIAYLEKAVKTDPLFADAYVRLAQGYKAGGDIGKYNFYLNKALEIDPQNELALDIRQGVCRFICIGNKI